MKVVINTCFGGFCLSEKALKLYCEFGGDENRVVSEGLYIDRHDPILIKVVENLGSEDSGGLCAQLEIINIPDKYSTCYRIIEHDGCENIEPDFQKLISGKLSSYDINSMELGKCRGLLWELMDLVRS